jgi:hypothetical protein
MSARIRAAILTIALVALAAVTPVVAYAGCCDGTCCAEDCC